MNIPIGLAGLCMVYLHLPDYREHTDPLDVAGLILFGSGVALLSYVLEVFGEHTLNARRNSGASGAFPSLLLAGYGFHATRTAHPMLHLVLFRIRTFRAAVSGSFLTRLGIGGIPFLFPLLVSGRPRVHADSIRPAHDAAGDCGHEPEADDAADSGALRLPRGADFEHADHRPADPAFRDHREGHAGVADRGGSVLLRVLHVAAIHEHEHAGLCRCQRGTGEQRKLHREHRCSRWPSVSASLRRRW